MPKKIKNAIAIDDINHIDIDVKEGTITIYETEQNDVIISGKGGNLFRELHSYREEDKIIVKQKNIYFPVNLMISQTKVSIGIPKIFRKNISIKNSTGHVLINGIHAKYIHMSSTAGSLTINDSIFDQLDLKVGTRGCNVDLKDKSGDIDINSSVGKVKVTLKEVGGNLKLKGGTRGGIVSVPKNAPIEIKQIHNKRLCVEASMSAQKRYLFYLKPSVGVIKLVNNTSKQLYDK